METPLDAALFEFIKRDHNYSNPKGIYAVDGIWHPDETEACICCKTVALSIKKFPSKYNSKLKAHCRELTHIANLFKVDRKELKEKIERSKYYLLNGMFDKLVHIKHDTRQYSAALFGTQCINCMKREDDRFIRIWTPIIDSDLDFYKKSIPEYQFHIIQQHPLFEALSKNLKDQGWFFGWFSMVPDFLGHFLMPAMYQHMTPKEGKEFYEKYENHHSHSL